MTNETIAGHTLTDSQRRTLDDLSAFLGKSGGEKYRMLDVWGRSNQATAHRRNVAILDKAGVLKACGIAVDNYGCVSGIPHGYRKLGSPIASQTPQAPSTEPPAKWCCNGVPSNDPTVDQHEPHCIYHSSNNRPSTPAPQAPSKKEKK
jgi:hypothetical protein